MNRRARTRSARRREQSAANHEPEEATVSDGHITYCKIFPPIGVARLGNSTDAERDHVLAPEVPGRVPDNGGGYKDAQGRVKRQAARFRVYGFNDRDEVVAELNAEHPEVDTITWSVTLANAKAEWWGFAGTA